MSERGCEETEPEQKAMLTTMTPVCSRKEGTGYDDCKESTTEQN